MCALVGFGHVLWAQVRYAVAVMRTRLPSEREIAQRFEAGTVLEGRYRLERLLGEGGHALVWRATQCSTGQEVAIKLLRPGPDGVPTPRRAARFEREMALISRLRHPAIVRLIDAGRAAQTLYAVFELVEGTTLATRLAMGGALSPHEAARVMSQVLEAIGHAHRHGVIHRDLKPDNVMLSGPVHRPLVKVVDFGIAGVLVGARAQDYASITRSADFVGTPAYMAPEQIGYAKALTPRIDIYAWGLVFAECLSGKRVVDAPSLMEQAMAHASDAPHVLPASVAPPLRAIIERAIAKEPQARFTSADEALAALDAALPGIAVDHGGEDAPAMLEEGASGAGALAETHDNDSDATAIAVAPLMSVDDGGATVRLDREAIMAMRVRTPQRTRMAETSLRRALPAREPDRTGTRRRVWPMALVVGLASVVAALVWVLVVR